MTPSEEDVVLKLLHTADWHLGLRFPSFSPEDDLRLARARLDAVERILYAAEQHSVDAVLCAGDLFDGPTPARDWWQGLSRLLAKPGFGKRPIVLLPGNHDPLVPGSPWERGSGFRAELPDWVHVVDTDDFTLELTADAVLHAAPCRSQAGAKDLALSLPARADGDRRIRIGMVHGTTFDLPNHQAYFPVARDAAERRGFDYLAIGDTHAFRDVRPDSRAPVVYPSAPEATGFDEKDTGFVALVFFPARRSRRPLVERLPVAHWIWRQETCHDLESLVALRELPHLERTVLRVAVDMTVSLGENRAVQALLAELGGTDATHGLAGVLEAHTDGLRIDPRDADEVFAGLPAVLERTAARLRAKVAAAEGTEGGEGEVARRALDHLYKLVREGD